MSNFLQLCEVEPRLEALRQEALEIAAWSGGRMNQIRDLWYGKMNQPGLKTRMIQLLKDPAIARELHGRQAYYECYEGLWAVVNSTRGGEY
jgi:hypothetical protein